MTKSLYVLAVLLTTFSINIYADAGAPDIQWADNSDSRIAPIDNDQYKKSCGSCHEAYAAGLLPPQSWEKVVFGFDDHFGQKVQLDDSDLKTVLNYLLGSAAGRSKYTLSRRMLSGLKNEQPIRITKLPFFISKHQKLDANLTACSACHTQVSKGSFDIKEIKTP